MRIRTDDEVYRVDAVWLGPPEATFPVRARYVAWGVGVLAFFLVVIVQRQLGIGLGFFSLAWGLVISVVLTRVITSRISHERPLGAVAALWRHELRAPRRPAAARGGDVGTGAVRHAALSVPSHDRGHRGR